MRTMDRSQILLLGLPLFLFFSDIVNLFTPPPSTAITLHFTPTLKRIFTNPSISLPRVTAVTVKNMPETAFPGNNVVLANYPPTLTKRMLSKAAQVVQIGVIGIIVAGEQIFSRLGITTPPQWYYSACANSFRSMATSWLLGNFIQSFLQNFGSFEVYCNGELVFSKLKENRFPGEIELRDLIG